DADELGTLLGQPSGYRVLRGPESGLVMVRGRTGGGGAPLHLGEKTITRCPVPTDAGFGGHSYVARRNARLAEVAPGAQALLQDPDHQMTLLDSVIKPLAATQQTRRDAVAAKAAATRVQFFAMRNMRS